MHPLAWFILGLICGSYATYRVMRLVLRMSGASVKLLLRWSGVPFPLPQK